VWAFEWSDLNRKVGIDMALVAEPRARLLRAMNDGSYREQLEALRDVLAAQIIDCSPRDMAPLTNQLAKTIAALNDLPAAEDVDPSVKLRADAAARRALAKSKLAAV
jgi:hypothetical protein